MYIQTCFGRFWEAAGDDIQHLAIQHLAAPAGNKQLVQLVTDGIQNTD
jgi:hypothetical protein